MFTWLVVTVLDTAIIIAGPLPLGMADCRARAEQASANLRANWVELVADNGPTVMFGRPFGLGDIETLCVMSPVTPELGEKIGEGA